MTRVDNHSHILLANIVDMVSAAKARDLSEYSITEHVSQFRELRESIKFGSIHSTGRMFNDLKEYTDEFRKVDDHEDWNMKINRGLEIDFSPRFEKQVGDFVGQEKWSILLCSVHEFDDRTDIERALGVFDTILGRKRWSEYLRLENMALESDFVPFNVLSHPVRLARGKVNPPPEIDDLLVDLARTARRRNKALELNGNDIGYAPQLVRTLAQACSTAGCRVSLGSDAHHPKDVFRNMEAALGIVEEFKLQMFASSVST
ncbi:MAG TPA: PHP domain-containing protein [Candidatus Bathyarchaeia archaeon]|nr:PHP domain-containing protein [Candidatus Bathyarchaeia archaeon]